MNSPIKAAVLAATTLLGGCAQLQGAVDFVNQPSTQRALATVRTVATAFACDVSSGSQLALAVESQLSGTSGAQATTGVVYTASAALCSRLSGVVVGTASGVPAVSSVEK